MELVLSPVNPSKPVCQSALPLSSETHDRILHDTLFLVNLASSWRSILLYFRNTGYEARNSESDRMFLNDLAGGGGGRSTISIWLGRKERLDYDGAFNLRLPLTTDQKPFRIQAAVQNKPLRNSLENFKPYIHGLKIFQRSAGGSNCEAIPTTDDLGLTYKCS